MPIANPSERELQALKILWQQGQATVREVCDALADRGERLAYTTVLSLLQVMEQKELVGHTQSGKVYSYFPKVERDHTFRSLANGFLQSVFDGATDQYLLHALGDKRLSRDELERLEKMIAEAKSRARRAPADAKRASSKRSSSGDQP